MFQLRVMWQMWYSFCICFTPCWSCCLHWLFFFLTLGFGCMALGSDSVVRGILTTMEEFLPLRCRVQNWHVGKLHWLEFHCSQFLDKMLYNWSVRDFFFFVCFKHIVLKFTPGYVLFSRCKWKGADGTGVLGGTFGSRVLAPRLAHYIFLIWHDWALHQPGKC